MVKKLNILEVVYKDPKGMYSGGVENYAFNVKKVLRNSNFNFTFAYWCTDRFQQKSNMNKRDICIKIPNIPFFKKLIFNIELYNYLKKINWRGIIHINGDNGVFCTQLKGVKTLLTLHGSSLQYATTLIKMKPYKLIDILGNALSGLMELYAYLTADKIVGVSRYCLDFMGKFMKRSYYIIPPSVERMPRIIDKNKYRAAFGFEKDQLLCIFVGGDAKRKGLDTAIDTVAKINNNKIKLLIVGLNKKPKINKNCKFFGRVDKETLEKLYSISDILFFPSRYEGFPTVIPEAMSYGVVPLVYDKKPFNEIARMKNSFLAYSQEEFVNILSSLIYNRGELIQKQKICRIEARKFLARKLFFKYSKIFKELAKYDK